VARRAGLLLWLLTASAGLSCSGQAEQQILRGYFETCATADAVALANVALAVLDPVRDGVVGHFKVLTVGPLIRQPPSSYPGAAALSLHDRHGRHDAADAALETKDVQIRAQVHRGGAAIDQRLTVTLARGVSAGQTGRWIVVRLVPGGRTLPAASSGPR